jgi:hypothetical protein
MAAAGRAADHASACADVWSRALAAPPIALCERLAESQQLN